MISGGASAKSAGSCRAYTPSGRKQMGLQLDAAKVHRLRVVVVHIVVRDDQCAAGNIRSFAQGLGLLTVHGIVNQPRGYVAIYSEVGMGTRVTALFPATDQTPIASVDEAAPKRRADATVLIVEDADDIPEVASRILTHNARL